MIKRLNINCDLGEGMPNDALLMPHLFSCNIACGGHYGDVNTIRETIRLAQKFEVKIGAHPSFPDRENFGRKVLQMNSKSLIKSISDQILLFEKIAKEEGAEVHHIKLHGALYNLAASNTEIAKAIISALQKAACTARLYAPFKSELAKAAKNNFEVIHEAFIDRTYQANLSLTPRANDNALVTEPEKAWQQLSDIYLRKKVQTTTELYVSIQAETFCIHGDSPSALAILEFIHQKLNHV